jgi:hypothetical protein
MFAHITKLCYWKSEHSESTCEDAYDMDAASGLFVVADGAGTTLFSDIWANILVKHYLTVPLLSSDAFEVEWWVRQAQEQFKQSAPFLPTTAWNAVQKAQNQGSYSTLAMLRVVRNDVNSAQAELLAFGDSCIFIGNLAIGQMLSFPLSTPSQFELAPICIPSKPALFNRYFHQCSSHQVELTSNTIVVLATDAVAKWIVSGGAGRYAQPIEALWDVSRQTPETWATFINECRHRDEMVDDDSTALIILFYAEAHQGTVKFGATTKHSPAIREKRKNDFLQAVAADHKELAAICTGDGEDLSLEGVALSADQFRLNREVADALRVVLHMLRQEMNSPQGVAKVETVWKQYAMLLQNEVCAENLRLTLARMGIAVTSPVKDLLASEGTDISSLPTTILSVDHSLQTGQVANPSEPLYSETINLSEDDVKQARSWFARLTKRGPNKDI